MSRKKHERRRARESALALLYSSEITEQDVVEIVEGGAYPDDGIAITEYAELLVDGVNEHLGDIDAQLMAVSENWALDRMPFVDRAILRVAVFEMLYVEEVPVSVAINEAVELAKLYGGEDDSSRFVNGVLGRISRGIERAQNPAGEEQLGEEQSGEDAVQADEGTIQVGEDTTQPAVDDAAPSVDAGADAGESAGEAPLQ